MIRAKGRVRLTVSRPHPDGTPDGIDYDGDLLGIDEDGLFAVLVKHCGHMVGPHHYSVERAPIVIGEVTLVD